MKKVTHFICETCGTEYNSADKAKECEKGHKTVYCVAECRYLPFKSCGTGYPQKVSIRFDDGSTAWYTRKG